MKIINARNITKIFTEKKQSHKVLYGVDFELNKGEFVAIVGESGSGKSTFGKILLGLINPTEGEVLFNEKPSSNYSSSERHRFIQMVLQNPYSAFDPIQSIEESLKEVIFSNGIVDDKHNADEIINTQLDKYGLSKIDIKRPTHKLSGGQLQRLGILRAMLVKPEVLVADEVVSALDNELKLVVLDILKKLQEKFELSIIFITHNIGSIQNYADRIVVFKDGKIVEKGSANQILFNPKVDYTVKLLNSLPNLRVKG